MPSHFVGLQCEIPAQVAEKPSLKQASASIFMVLWSLGRLWAESGRDYATAPTSLLSRTRLKAVAVRVNNQPTRARPR